MAGEIIFLWVKAFTGTSIPFKWTIGNARYEVHNPELESFDLADLLPHVLEVRKKVISVCAKRSEEHTSELQSQLRPSRMPSSA